METDVAKHDRARRNRRRRSRVGRIVSDEIAFELEKLGVRGHRAGELPQHLTHFHRWRGDAGKDGKHRQDNRRWDVEQNQADKGDQCADQSGDDRGGEPVAILLTEIGKLLALEPAETVGKFGDEIGLAVLPSGELQPAEKLRGLMR